ncbi:major capsid protein [Brachybacterium paraconglomeratum]
MAILADQFPPSDTTDYGRGVVESVDNTVLQSIFPNKTQNSNVASWQEKDRHRNEAKYRSWGAETEFGRRAGGVEKTQKLAPLGLKLPYLEDDAIAVANGIANEADIVSDLTGQVSESVVNTLQRQRAGALENAGYLAEGENFSVPVDFVRDPALDAAPSTLFDASGADPIEFISARAEAIRKASGRRPTVILGSARIQSALARSAAMISYAGAGKVNVIGNDVVDSLLSSFGLPRFVRFDEDGSDGAPLLSEHKLYFARDDGSVGHTAWGPSTAALNPKYGIARPDAPGLFVGVYEEEDADTKYVRSDATALVVLRNPDATAAPAVLAAA